MAAAQENDPGPGLACLDTSKGYLWPCLTVLPSSVTCLLEHPTLTFDCLHSLSHPGIRATQHMLTMWPRIVSYICKPHPFNCPLCRVEPPFTEAGYGPELPLCLPSPHLMLGAH